MIARPLPRRTVVTLLAATWVAAGCGVWQAGAASDTLPPLNEADRRFALDAAASVHYQLEAAKLAEQRSADARIRMYAAMLAQANTRAADELRALVQARGHAWVGGVPTERRAVLDAMATLTVELFDRRFIDQIGIADHAADLTLFEQAARQATDPELRHWADRMVPVLRNHLDAAHQLPVRQLARA